MNLASNLDLLQQDLASIVQITQTDSGPLSITAAQYANDSGALGKIGSYTLDVSGVAASNVAAVLSDSHVASISVSGTLADVATNYGILSQDLSRISLISLTDHASIDLGASLFRLVSPLLDKLAGASLVSVTDTASDLGSLPLSGVIGPLGISLSAMDANATLGANVAQLDLRDLSGASFAVKSAGTDTEVDITSNGVQHALTLQGESPFHLAIVSTEGNLSAATFSSTLLQATISNGAAGLTVQDSGVTDVFSGVSRLHFSNESVAFDLGANQSAGQAAELIGAAYGSSSVSDAALFGQTLALFDGGKNMQQAAQTVLNGLNFGSYAAFVSAVWQNLAGSPIDAADLSTFTGLLNNGTFTEASLLAAAASLSVNQSNIGLVGLASHGIAFIPA